MFALSVGQVRPSIFLLPPQVLLFFFTFVCFLFWLILLVFVSASPGFVCEEKSFWYQLLFSRTSIDYCGAVFALSVGQVPPPPLLF